MASRPDSDGSLGRRLDVKAVMALYGIGTARAARKLMREVGCFEVAGRLMVRESDLLAHQERRIAAQRLPAGPGPSRAPWRHTRPENRSSGWDHGALAPDFYKADSQTGAHSL